MAAFTAASPALCRAENRERDAAAEPERDPAEQDGQAGEMQKKFEKMYPPLYRVRLGDTLSTIAARREIFNDQFMWPLIYKANRDQIRDPRIVYVGQKLTVPRKLTMEDIIEARQQAEAPCPAKIPRGAYTPDIYKKFFPFPPSAPEDAAAGRKQTGH